MKKKNVFTWTTVVGQILLVCMISPLSILAGHFFVRPSGSGTSNGADWNNAFSGFSSVVWGTGGVGGGDTLFVAGGVYNNAPVPTAAGSEGSPVVVRRATAERHGTDAGWQSSFDLPAIINDKSIVINVSHVTIDGAVPDGIKIKRNGFGTQDKGIEFIKEADHVTLRYIEIEGPGYPTAADGRGIDVTPSSGSCDNILIERCRIYNFPNGIYLLNCSDVTIQHCDIYNLQNTAAVHENGVYSDNSTRVTYRYNRMWNAAAEGVFARSDQSHWYVYGNLFYNSGYGFATKADYVHTDMYVHNNTFSNVHIAVGFKNSSDAGAASNNLFYGCATVMWGGVSQSSNWYSDNTDPFVNCSGGDFRLSPSSPPVNAGKALAAPYDLDPNGAVRGADGAWDIGAYESGDMAPLPLKVDPVGISVGAGESISQQLHASGGTPPYTWRVLSGAIPPAVSVSSSGLISGSAADPGSWTAVVEAADKSGDCATGALTFTVAAAAEFSVEEVWPLGSGAIMVSFTSVPDAAAAEDISHYTLSGGASVVSASLSGATVELETSAHTAGAWLTLCIEGITSAAGGAVVPACFEFTVSADIEIEAEQGSIDAPMTVHSVPDASGGECVATEMSNEGVATYTFVVEQEGPHVLLARVSTGGESKNSFYFSLDADTQCTWDIVSMPAQWSWVSVSSRGAGTFDAPEVDSVVVLLTAGQHSLSIMGREKDTRLDRLALRPLGSDAVSRLPGGAAHAERAQGIQLTVRTDSRGAPRLSYVVDRPCAVVIRFFDGRGRQVFGLSKAVASSGLHILNWNDGSSRTHESLAAGRYVGTLRAGEETATAAFSVLPSR